MATAMVKRRGKITLPKIVCTRLGLEAGHRVEFVATDAGFLIKRATRDIQSLKGILRKPGRPITIESMNRSIARTGRTR